MPTPGRWLWVAGPESYDEKRIDQQTGKPAEVEVNRPGHPEQKDFIWACHRDTRAGDSAVVYRSRRAKDIRYLVEVDSDAEPGAAPGEWECRYRIVSWFDPPLTLDTIRGHPVLRSWSALGASFVSGGRVDDQIWSSLMEMHGARARATGPDDLGAIVDYAVLALHKNNPSSCPPLSRWPGRGGAFHLTPGSRADDQLAHADPPDQISSISIRRVGDQIIWQLDAEHARPSERANLRDEIAEQADALLTPLREFAPELEWREAKRVPQPMEVHDAETLADWSSGSSPRVFGRLALSRGEHHGDALGRRLTALRPLAETLWPPRESRKVFVCYPHTESCAAWAMGVADAVKQSLRGERVTLLVDKNETRDNRRRWDEKLTEGIDNCDAALIFLTAQTLDREPGWQLGREVPQLLARRDQKNGPALLVLGLDLERRHMNHPLLSDADGAALGLYRRGPWPADGSPEHTALITEIARDLRMVRKLRSRRR